MKKIPQGEGNFPSPIPGRIPQKGPLPPCGGGTGRGVSVVLCTCPPTLDVKKLANTLIEQKLAACVNMVPKITSIYPWKGQICEESEILLVIKTTEKAYPKLEAAIREYHPYEVPEILALPTAAGFAPYLEWVENNIGF